MCDSLHAWITRLCWVPVKLGEGIRSPRTGVPGTVRHPVWVLGNDPVFSQEQKCSDRWVISAALITLIM